MKKKIIIFVSTLALLLCSAFPAMAEDVWYGRYGEADGETGRNIVVLCQSIHDTYEVETFYFYTDQMLNEAESKTYAQSVVDEYADVDNTVSFVRGPEAGYIFTTGICDDVFTDDVTYAITQATASYEINNQYDLAALTFFANVQQYLTKFQSTGVDMQGEDGANETDAVLLDSQESVETIGAEQEAAVAEKKSSPVKGIAISLVIGLIVAAIVIASIKSKYKPVHKNVAANEYLVNGSLQITGGYENFVKTDTTQRELSQNNNNNNSK